MQDIVIVQRRKETGKKSNSDGHESFDINTTRKILKDVEER